MRMFGQFLHPDIPTTAAADLFHFAASQGFVDGNKRAAAACAITFLAVNGYDLTCTDEELYDLTMRIANNLMDKDAAADWLRQHLPPNRLTHRPQGS